MASQWQMFKDWSIFAGLLFAYDYSRGLADQLGRSVDFTVARGIDRVLFFGVNPNVWLQQRLNVSSDLAWYEYPLAITYMTHFILPIGAAIFLWIKNREQWVLYMRRFAILLFSGVATYIVFPVAPPWMAARDGYTEPLRRITARGWSDIGLHTVSKVFERGTAITNPVAAMPSLHAAFALFVVVFFWRQMPKWFRGVALLLPASMALCLVYFAEHNVSDVLAGWLYVVLAMWLAKKWETRARPLRRTRA
jgi:membrane-associated phospholipid phosphatase